jgi:hypothetical protein
MKTRYLLIPVIIFAVPCLLFSRPKVLKPLNNKNKLVIIESGKQRIYYPIPQNDPSIILVKGPGKLRVKTRVQFSKELNRADYTIYYNIDGGRNIETRFNNVERSKKIRFKNSSDGWPGLHRDIIIELGPGEHNLNFRRRADKPVILGRYLFTKFKEKKLKWVMLSPSPPNEPVDLVTHENVIHYYRFSEKKPLKIKIIGPTVVRVLTRFENHYNMKGRINYRLQLKENGNLIHTYLLSSIFSDVTTYRHNNRLVPGKAREFYIEVPSGRHTYTVMPMDKDKNTILARILFPKKDVKLEY